MPIESSPVLQRATAISALFFLFSACDGQLSVPAGPAREAQNAARGGTLNTVEGNGDFANGNFDAKACQNRELSPGAMPGLVRLTHAQYDYAVADLLGLDGRARTDFVKDQVFYGFDNNALKMVVPENQVQRYQLNAERLAQEASAGAIAGSGQLGEHVPCIGTQRDDACRDAFIDEFLKLVFRRPLSNDERDAYQALFQQGADLYEDGDAFERGLRVVLEAALQSPSFIYRAELRGDEAVGSVVPLTDHELAARLSFSLWGSVPDAKLLVAADRGELHEPSQIEREVQRMLDDPRAARMIDDFHAQWLELSALHFAKDSASFPGYDETAFAAAAQAEALAFSRYVLLEKGGSVADLFTLPMGFVSAPLAQVYGVESTSSTPTRVDLDAQQRAGLLTQSAFLAGRADPLDPSPIHRGAYVQKRVLCATFGPVPGNVGSLPARTPDIVTTRDQVEVKTSPEPCQSCHKLINPVGFAFEHFDALGRFRNEDHGAPVDATAELTLDGKVHEYDGAVELGALLADSPTATRCYETQWFRYLYGRGESGDDLCLLHGADQAYRARGGSIRDMLLELTLSRGFRFRTVEGS